MSFKTSFILELLLFVNLIFAQNNKEIKVTLLHDNINVSDLCFYLISKNKVDKLDLVDSKLNFEYDSESELKLIARLKKKCLEFFISPTNIHYLEIEKMPFRLNNFFRKKYIINQGFDYEVIVKSCKCNIN